MRGSAGRWVWVAGALSGALAGACATAPPPRSSAVVSIVGTRAPEISSKIGGLEHRPGLFDLYLDAAQGKLLAVLPAATGARGRIGEYLYVEGIATGLGSNPVGLDRGQLGESRVLVVRRVGSRVLFEEPNLRYRALTDDADELDAVRESFATSVHWAGEVLAEDDEGRVLVDLTGFALRDAHGSPPPARGRTPSIASARRSTSPPASPSPRTSSSRRC